MRLAFDTETDGFLRRLTKIHCIVARDLDTGQEYRWDNDNIKNGLQFLLKADELWGHNIIGYDYEAIREIYPKWVYKGTTYDTLILSRLFFTDLLDRDFRNRPTNMPANLYGRHSLEAWGHRVGVHKSEFGKSLEGDWSTYSPEMLEYCAQDVVVTVRLVNLFEPRLEQYERCIDTEHQIARIMSWQEREGFPFDVTKAHQLEAKLRSELDSLSDEMRATFVFVDGGKFTPKRNNRSLGYVAECPMSRLKEFNPTSRDHIAWAFETFRNWTPKEYTKSGKAQIDAQVLTAIGIPEAIKFARILELQQHLGLLSEGKNAWLKQEEGNRIHHSCMLNTNTGRMAHSDPNLAQVPSAPEYRELFYPGPNRVQVGADASGLELRCLGHYLTPFDGGAFAKEVVEGDIHTVLAGIYGTTRSIGKSVTYATIYGAGDMKLGLTAGATKEDAVKRGKDIKKRMLSGLAGFAALQSAIAERAKTDVLRGLDGRPIRLQGKKHAATNYLLQSAGAVICKLWCIRANELLQEAGIDYWPMAFIHDELQFSVAPSQVDMAELLITAAMKDVEQHIGFQCQLDSEAKHGSNWAECH